MRTELCYPHETFYLQLGSRDVTDNKTSDPASPPIKDCHSPTTPSSPAPALQQLHQQQHHHQAPIFAPAQHYSMPPSVQQQLPAAAATVAAAAAVDSPPTERDHSVNGPVVGVQLNFEEARRKTFTAAWPHAFLDTNLLAQTGFYFIGPNDNVKCFFCKVEIGRWETDDHEVTEHQRWSQNCPLLKRRVTANVPLDAAQLERVLPPVTVDVCGPGGGGGIDVRHNTISEGSFDVYPSMAAMSVGPAPVGAAQSHDMGPDVHPMAHYHHSSVAEAQLHQQQQQQQQQQHQLQPQQQQPHSHHHQHHSASISVQTAPSIRYPDHPEYAIESARLRSFDDWPKTMKQKPKDLSDAGFFYTMKGDRVKCFSCGGGLRDWDENDVPWEQHAQWFGHCQYLQLIKGPEYIEEVLRRADADKAAEQSPGVAGAASVQSAAAQAVAAAAAAVAATESAASAAADDLNGPGGRKICDSKLCKICYSCEYNTAFLPCGHVVACAKCASSVTKCPMCRKPFERVMRVYFS